MVRFVENLKPITYQETQTTMARVTTQKKSKQGKPIQCGRCNVPIEPGTTYRRADFRFGPSLVRCLKPECNPRDSELVGGHASSMHALNERLADLSVGEFSEVRSYLDDMESIKEDAESLRDEIQEGFDNMTEGLQQGDTGQTAEARVEALESFIEELDSAIDEHRAIFDELEEEEDGREDEKAALAEEVLSAFSGISLEVE